MHRLLDVLTALIAAIWPANRRPVQDTATANGPQALPAVERLATATPAIFTDQATEATPGLARSARTPDHGSKPRGASQSRGPPCSPAPQPPQRRWSPADRLAG